MGYSRKESMPCNSTPAMFSSFCNCAMGTDYDYLCQPKAHLKEQRDKQFSCFRGKQNHLEVLVAYTERYCPMSRQVQLVLDIIWFAFDLRHLKLKFIS